MTCRKADDDIRSTTPNEWNERRQTPENSFFFFTSSLFSDDLKAMETSVGTESRSSIAVVFFYCYILYIQKTQELIFLKASVFSSGLFSTGHRDGQSCSCGCFSYCRCRVVIKLSPENILTYPSNLHYREINCHRNDDLFSPLFLTWLLSMIQKYLIF